MKKNYAGLIALGMALVMALSLVCFSIPSTATGDTSGSTSSGESTTKGGSGASATSGESSTTGGSGASASSGAESTDAAEDAATEEEAAWYAVAERVDPETLPESLTDFLRPMIEYSGDYDYQHPVPEEGEPSLLYNAIKVIPGIDYTAHEGHAESVTVYLFEHIDDAYVLEEDKDAERVSTDPLSVFYDEEAAEEDASVFVNTVGYLTYPASKIDWVLHHIYHCSPSAVFKMRSMLLSVEASATHFIPYYYKGEYYTPYLTGFGSGVEQKVRVLDAYYDGKGYDIYFVNSILEEAYGDFSGNIRHARVAPETIGEKEYWTLYKLETMPDAIPLQVMAEKDDATKKQITAVEGIIENVGFDNAAESYDVGRSKEEQLVLLFEDEDAGLAVYDCIPANYEKEHILLIRKGEGEDELRRYVKVTTRPDHLDFSMTRMYSDAFAMTYCTGHGTGFYQSEMLFCFETSRYLEQQKEMKRELQLMRMPTEKICEQIEETLELRFDNATARLEIADLRTADYRLLGAAEGDPDAFAEKPVEEMKLSENVRQYRMDGFPTLQLCIQPVGEDFADGMYLADFRLALYPELGAEEDFVNQVYVGPLTETNLY